MRHIFIYTIIILSFLGSCAKDPTDTSNAFGEEGTLVKVRMQFVIPSFDSPKEATKGVVEQGKNSTFSVKLVDTKEQTTRSSGTTSLYNLWVLQFGPDDVVRKITKLSDVPEAIKDMVTIDTDLLTGENQTIYLVSLGKQYGSIDLSGIKNISELENYTLDFVKYEDGIATPIIQKEDDIPYRGLQRGLSIIQLDKNGKGLIEYDPSLNFSGAIPIYAMVAQVTFDFSFDVSNFTPSMLMLNNVPTNFAINNPSYKSSNYVNLKATKLNASDFTGGKRYTKSWYLAPNPQGVVSGISTETDRYYYYLNSSAKGKAPANGTYFNFWASDNSRDNNYAIYYIFLGGNTTNDFNIYAHNNYKFRSDINTSDYTNDLRIVYKLLQQTVDFGASERVGGKTYAALRSGIRYDLDAHADMRPIEVCALRGVIKVDILGTSDISGSPIEKSNSWLKVSLYPNYTEAYQKNITGDAGGLSTSITQNADIPGIFKFYIYSDEYQEYTAGNPAEDKKRSLYVRFTFVSGTATDVTLVRMDQRPGFYIGQFGEKFNTATGEYSKGLVYESIPEYTTDVYVRYLSYYMNTSMVAAGAYNADYYILCDEYKVGDLYNGKEATILSAINKGQKYRLQTTSLPAEAPKYIAGKLDLYQYSMQKLNYFSARYCFDKNRDLDGDGDIEGDEIVWYLPAYFQNTSLIFNMYGDRNSYMSTLFSNMTIPSTSQHQKNNFYIVTSYDFSSMNATSSYGQYPRCVRDVELPKDGSYPKGFKVYAEDGYVVIDAQGMSPSVREDRGGINSNKILNADGRVIRHLNISSSNHIINKTLASIVSSRFRVAQYDISISGDERTYGPASNGVMTWAEASGYNTVGNSFVLTEAIEAANTGCPMYGGKDGSEVGKWRLPTQAEIVLMAFMEPAMAELSTQTGYKPLLDPKLQDFSSFGYSYWTSSEYISNKNSTDPVKQSAALYERYSVKEGQVDSYLKGELRIGRSKTEGNIVRCIRDLAEK